MYCWLRPTSPGLQGPSDEWNECWGPCRFSLDPMTGLVGWVGRRRRPQDLWARTLRSAPQALGAPRLSPSHLAFIGANRRTPLWDDAETTTGGRATMLTRIARFPPPLLILVWGFRTRGFGYNIFFYCGCCQVASALTASHNRIYLAAGVRSFADHATRPGTPFAKPRSM